VNFVNFGSLHKRKNANVFYNNFVNLCNKANKSPSAVDVEMGFQKSVVTRWKKNNATPTDANLAKISNYFNVSVDDLKGNEQKEKPTLSNKDERDVARDLESIMADLDKGGALMFDGDPMTDEAKEGIKATMKLGLQAAKQKNKERFIPNKFRKE